MDGRTVSCREGCAAGDLSGSPKGKRGHCPHNKTSRDSLSHGTLVDQSSPENCSTSDYGPMCPRAMAPMGIV
jgi:hypothetical protein